MVDFRRDQAEGLRRLLEYDHLRVMTITSGYPGVGKTSVVINVAAALAARGLRVLVIDENYGPENVCGFLGIRPNFDIRHVMRQTCKLEDALVELPSGVCILGASGGARTLPSLRQHEQEQLMNCFGRLDGRFDRVLIDTSCDSAVAQSMFSIAVQDTIIVSSAATDAITASYTLVKRMRNYQSGRRYYLLLNRVACESNAQVIAENLKKVAHRYLATPLECLGSVPLDDNLRRAARGFQSVIDANPAAPSAKNFMRIADSIAQWPRCERQFGGFDSLLQRLLLRNRFVFANAGV